MRGRNITETDSNTIHRKLFILRSSASAASLRAPLLQTPRGPGLYIKEACAGGAGGSSTRDLSALTSAYSEPCSQMPGRETIHLQRVMKG